MYFRAAVIALLGCLVLFHVEGQVSRSIEHKMLVSTILRERDACAAPAEDPARPSTPQRTVDIARGDLERIASDPELLLRTLGLEPDDELVSFNGRRAAGVPYEVVWRLRGLTADFADLEIRRENQTVRVVVLVHGSI